MEVRGARSSPTAAHPAAACAVQSDPHFATMMPTMASQTHMPTDPAIISGLRPTRSMYNMAGMVVATLMMPMTPVARREEVLLVRPRDWKIIGA